MSEEAEEEAVKGRRNLSTAKLRQLEGDQAGD